MSDDRRDGPRDAAGDAAGDAARGPGEQDARTRRRAERRRLLASGPASPCISVCQLDDRTGWCIGCYRTIDEIRDWIIMPPEERRRVLVQLQERRRGPARAGTSDPE